MRGWKPTLIASLAHPVIDPGESYRFDSEFAVRSVRLAVETVRLAGLGGLTVWRFG